MMNDKSSEIGCEMVTFMKDDLNVLCFLSLIIQIILMDLRRVFMKLVPLPSSNYVTGCHKIFKTICGNDEKIDSKYINDENICIVFFKLIVNFRLILNLISRKYIIKQLPIFHLINNKLIHFTIHIVIITTYFE